MRNFWTEVLLPMMIGAGSLSFIIVAIILELPEWLVLSATVGVYWCAYKLIRAILSGY